MSSNTSRIFRPAITAWSASARPAVVVSRLLISLPVSCWCSRSWHLCTFGVCDHHKERQYLSEERQGEHKRKAGSLSLTWPSGHHKIASNRSRTSGRRASQLEIVVLPIPP